jgi:hypothetical protein
MSAAPQFLSHRNLARHASIQAAPTIPIPPHAARSSLPDAAEARSTSIPAEHSIASPPRIPEGGHPQSLDKAFNDAEERALYGTLESEQPADPISPWFGAQALGIATALVLGSAGLGAWGMAKVMGVESVRFGARGARHRETSGQSTLRW